MLASVWKIPASLTAVCLALALAGCKTDNPGSTASAAPPIASLLPMPPSLDRGLIGWDSSAIVSLYGKPTFVRKEKEAELWRYDGAQCAAFFFFYQEQAGLRVRHVETLPKAGAMADAACLAGIKARATATS